MKYQMHCPKCNHEWAYDNGYYDSNIECLGIEIREIMLQLQEHKLLPYTEQRARTDWWLRAKKALTIKQKELAELKAFRKSADQQLKAMEYHLFKQIVKERFGEGCFGEILAQVESELEAYQVSGLMRHEYTRSNAKGNVTSISKL